jgi:hypothetical protein
MNPFHLNLIVAWLWILLGFLSGCGLGLGFHRENWLGGYSSFKRRLYRLGHISLFALGAVNLFFYITTAHVTATGMTWIVASRGFIAGAILMPICCLIMAHWPRARLLFGLPVLSLVVAAIATLTGVLRSTPLASSTDAQLVPCFLLI